MALKYRTADQISGLTSRLHLLRVSLGSDNRAVAYVEPVLALDCDLRNGQWLDTCGHFQADYAKTTYVQEHELNSSRFQRVIDKVIRTLQWVLTLPLKYGEE